MCFLEVLSYMFLVRSCKSLGLFVWNMVLLAFWVADILLIICGHAKGRVWPGNQQARLAPCQMPVVNSIINKTPKTTVTILWSYQLSQNERSQRKRWYTCNISHHTLKLYQPNFGIWDGFLLLSSHQQLLSSPGSLGSMGSTLPPRHPEPRDATRQWCRSWCPSRWYAPASRERRPRLPWGGTSAAVFFQKKKKLGNFAFKSSYPRAKLQGHCWLPAWRFFVWSPPSAHARAHLNAPNGIHAKSWDGCATVE